MFVKFYPYGIGSATGKCASTLFTYSPSCLATTIICFSGPSSKFNHIVIRDQLDPLNTRTKTIQPDQNPAYKKPTISTKTRVATIIINNFLPHSKLFSETEGFLVDSASYLEIKSSDLLCCNVTPKLPFFLISIEPLNHIPFLFSRMSHQVAHNT